MLIIYCCFLLLLVVSFKPKLVSQLIYQKNIIRKVTKSEIIAEPHVVEQLISKKLIHNLISQNIFQLKIVYVDNFAKNNIVGVQQYSGHVNN